MEDLINLAGFLIFKVERKIFSLSKKQLKYQLRKDVHALEKNKRKKRRYSLYRLLRTEDIYMEAKRKELLSKREIEWCESVIYGKSNSDKEEYHSESIEEVDKVIKNRRSVRGSWEREPLQEEDFRELVEIARWSPSACNRQSWDFMLTNDKEKIKLLANQRGKWIENAPSCILVSVDLNAYKKVERNYTPYLDAGSVIQTLLLKAEVMGYGACWVNFGELEVDDEARQDINDLFSLPSEQKIVSIIPIGKYKKKPNPPGRKDPESMMYYEEYNG